MKEIKALPAVFVPKCFCKEMLLSVWLQLPFEKVTGEGEKEGDSSQPHLKTAKAKAVTKTDCSDGQGFGTNCFQHLPGPLRVFLCMFPSKWLLTDMLILLLHIQPHNYRA